MRVASLVMSLKTIHENCTAILALANDELLIASVEEQARVEARLLQLKEETRELIAHHNEIIDSRIADNHEDRYTGLSPMEQFMQNMHEVTLAPDFEIERPLENDLRETNLLSKFSAPVRNAYRFAFLVERDVRPLLQEADIADSLHLNKEEHLVMDVE